MDNFLIILYKACFVGIGATIIFDLWGVLLKYAFKVPPSNICLVGRWISYMPKGKFTHSNITKTPAKSGECLLGWAFHYFTGIMLSVTFILITGDDWLRHPAPVPAILFGVVTAAAPLFIMQPAFGFGIAASKTPNPNQARARSLMNHAAFGAGLYLFGFLASQLF